jgi:hypothetical protein
MNAVILKLNEPLACLRSDLWTKSVIFMDFKRQNVMDNNVFFMENKNPQAIY